MIANILGIKRSGLHTISNYIKEITKLSFNDNLKHDLFLGEDIPDNSLNLFEDIDLIKCESARLKDQKTDVKTFIVIRDPLNMVASRIKYFDMISSEGLFISPLALHQWRTYFDYYVAEKPLSNLSTIYVNFNKFVYSGNYRNAITNQITDTADHKNLRGEGLVVDSVHINKDGKTSDGVLQSWVSDSSFERYQYYYNVPAFKNLFSKEEYEIIEKEFNITYEGAKG